MPNDRHHPDRPSQLLEDVRFIHAVSGRRARRLVFTASPTPWAAPAVSVTASAPVSLLLASKAVSSR